MSSDSVLFSERPAGAGAAIGMATLNAPASLNALSLEMVDLLHARLQAWRDDPRIRAVWLEGAGERAFCAGGDVARVYREQLAHPDGGYARDFFSREYQLDYLIHTYPKPLLCWGSGIVMGGGIGLMVGAGQRIVTETSRLAMPEINIGLYPDVGGSWFLNRMPGHSGLFCALTAVSLNAADALYAGLADRFIPSQRKPELLDALSALAWAEPVEDHALVARCLKQFDDRAGLPASPLRGHAALIDAACDQPVLVEVVQAIEGLAGIDSWLAAAAHSLQSGSALTACVIQRQLWQGRHLSLREAFAMELALSCNMVEHGEFMEGVRAQLIDKDRQPRWRYREVAAVPPELLDQLFPATCAPGLP